MNAVEGILVQVEALHSTPENIDHCVKRDKILIYLFSLTTLCDFNHGLHVHQSCQSSELTSLVEP